MRQVEHLSELAATQPHAAYTVLVRSIISRWRYCLRAVNCSPDQFHRLDDANNTSLLPAFTGVSPSSDSPLRQLMGLTHRRGGLGTDTDNVEATPDTESRDNVNVNTLADQQLFETSFLTGSDESLMSPCRIVHLNYHGLHYAHHLLQLKCGHVMLRRP